MGYVANNMDDDLFGLIGKEPTLGVSRWVYSRQVNWVMMFLSGLFQFVSGGSPQLFHLTKSTYPTCDWDIY